MAKSVRERIEQGNANYERSALAEGKRFRVSWSIDSAHPNFRMETTLADAQARRDVVVRDLHIEIPKDYYERQAHLVQYEIWIDEHVDGVWRPHPSEARSGAHRVDYAD